MRFEFWKIKRELSRVVSQFLEPYRQLRDAFLRRNYRLRHAQNVKHFVGDVPWTKRVAVFLIYQPGGVADSVLSTCEHLRQQGYACLVVSNGNLTDVDISRILSNVAHMIIRPNFGYDFGGYQEAVLWLRQSGVELDYFLLLNDSVWFPALKISSFLSDMEKIGADLVGALSAQRGRMQRHQRKLFYASFMLLFSHKAWSSSEFGNFWMNYRQTSSKPQTIRFGERALSALFIHSDKFTHHAMVDQKTYQDLALLNDSTTWPLFAHELAVMDSALAQERNDLLLCVEDDTQDRWRDWYGRLCDTHNMFAIAQTHIVLRAGVPIIKKSKDPQNLFMLTQSLNSFRTSNALNPTVMQEIFETVDANSTQSSL